MRISVPSPSVSYFPAVVAWKKGFFRRQKSKQSLSSFFLRFLPVQAEGLEDRKVMHGK